VSTIETGQPRRGVAGTILALAVYATAVTTLTLVYPETPGGELPPVANALWGVTYLVLGSIVLWNRPRHVMAKVMLGAGLLALTTALTQVIGLHATSPFVDRLKWVGIVEYLGYGTVFALLIHLFPTGRPPSPAWRWPVRMLWLGTAGLVLGQMLGLQPSDGPAVAVGLLLFGGSYAIGLVSAVPSLGYRFWRSRDAERAQVKWFLLAVSIALVGWFTNTAVGTALTLFLPALAITVALTRYHLYDIDRIISRTASYLVVTGAVISIYVVLVTAMTRLLPTSSSLAVAIATLCAAAVFQPMLRVVRSAVDRRFNRAHYDALATIDGFANVLRTTIDTTVVSSELDAAVTRTLQPTSYRIWTA
jgi:hypothetical protein